MLTLRIAAILVFVASGVMAGPNQTVILQPSQIAGIVGETDGLVEPRLLVSFDLTSIPEGASVYFAAVRLHNGTLPWDVPHVPVSMGALTQAWNEDTVDWDGPSGSDSWDNPGGDYDKERIAYRVLLADATSPPKFVITGIVKDWTSGAEANYGLIAILENVADLQEIVYQFNALALRPTLEVRYIELEE